MTFSFVADTVVKMRWMEAVYVKSKKYDQKREEQDEEREMEKMEWIVRFVPKSRRPSRLPVAPRYRFGS